MRKAPPPSGSICDIACCLRCAPLVRYSCGHIYILCCSRSNKKQHLLTSAHGPAIESAVMKQLRSHLIVFGGLALGCATAPVPVRYDAVIRNGLIYDGSGSAPRHGDVAINGETIAAVGDIGSARG